MAILCWAAKNSLGGTEDYQYMTRKSGRQNEKCSRQVNIFPTSLNFITRAKERKVHFVIGFHPNDSQQKEGKYR
jgi:hypothetical protein